MDANLLKESAAGLTLLYVDAHPESREITERMMGRYFKKVHTASTGTEALDIFHEHKADLVLTNMQVAPVNGLELVRELRRLDSRQAVVMTSADGDGDFLLELINIGVDGFLPKPINPKTAVDVLGRVAQQIREHLQLTEYVMEMEDLQALMAGDGAFCDGTVTGDLGQWDDWPGMSDLPGTAGGTAEGETAGFFAPFGAVDREELAQLLGDMDACLGGMPAEDESLFMRFGRLGIALSRFGSVLVRHRGFGETGMEILDVGRTIVHECDSIVVRPEGFVRHASAFCSVLRRMAEEVPRERPDARKLLCESITIQAKTIREYIAANRNGISGDTMQIINKETE